ncbi:MAG: hypothetical protein ACLGHP_08875 [Vicinamibacteria bacterium]
MSGSRKPIDVRLDESDDCFALFDAVFSALSTELQWEQVPDEPSAVPEEGTPAPDADEVRLTLALDPADVGTPVTGDPGAPPVTAPARTSGDARESSGRDLGAFDLLDARVNGAGPTGARAAAPDVSLEPDEPLDAALDVLDATIRGDGWPGAAAGGVEPMRSEPETGDWFDNVVDRLDGAMRTPAPAAPVARLGGERTPVVQVTPFRAPRPQPVSGGGRLDRALAVLEALSDLRARLGGPVSPALRAETTRVLAEAAALCAEMGLATAAVRVEFAAGALGRDGQAGPAHEVDELIRHLRHDLGTWSIWPVSSSRAWTLALRLAPEVETAFPSARADVSEAGVCLGLSRHGAALFHLTRAGRRGVRALAVAADAAEAPAARRAPGETPSPVRCPPWPSGAPRSPGGRRPRPPPTARSRIPRP